MSWAMDLMTCRYQIPAVFEDWVVGIGERESFASTAQGGEWGLIHQFQHSDAPVDCPPVDWWPFLFPEGIDWASLDYGKPVHAPVAHVGRKAWPKRMGFMVDVMCLTASLLKKSVDGRTLSRMSSATAARHLNQLAAESIESYK
jgi:hypothetical protein